MLSMNFRKICFLKILTISNCSPWMRKRSIYFIFFTDSINIFFFSLTSTFSLLSKFSVKLIIKNLIQKKKRDDGLTSLPGENHARLDHRPPALRLLNKFLA